jgi:Flp pilus assembly protein TadB
MPWEALVSGLFALLAAVASGSFILRWIERMEQRRRWEAFRKAAPAEAEVAVTTLEAS